MLLDCERADGAPRRQAEETERAELLARTGAASTSSWRAGLLDDDAQSMGYVQNSKRVLEEAFQTGTAILTNMSGQRERLKVRKMQHAVPMLAVCCSCQRC